MSFNSHFNIDIRPATLQDNELLAAIGAETFYDSYAADTSPEDMARYLSASFGPEKQAAELADPLSKFFIAGIGGQDVGFVKVTFRDAPEGVIAQKPLGIAQLYARKLWIGRGVGPYLMAWCLDEARTAGCDLVWLTVWEKNPRAIRFYTKWGFVEVGAQPFRFGEELQRDLVMVRRVL